MSRLGRANWGRCNRLGGFGLTYSGAVESVPWSLMEVGDSQSDIKTTEEELGDIFGE